MRRGAIFAEHNTRSKYVRADHWLNRVSGCGYSFGFTQHLLEHSCLMMCCCHSLMEINNLFYKYFTCITPGGLKSKIWESGCEGLQGL